MTPEERPEIAITDAETDADLQAVRGLLLAYEREFSDDVRSLLARQGFREEVEGLPGRYSESRGGVLLIARRQGVVAGCVALRAIGPGECEMKRLFVAPAFRSLGLGGRLVAEILDRARRRGYRSMHLDSTTEMAQAIALYRRFGFQERGAVPGDLPALLFEKAL